MSAPAPQAFYRPEEPIWVRLEQDVQQIRRDMVTKADMVTMMATKADAGVSEERWKGVWQDIAEIRTEMRQRPLQQQQQQQQQQQNLFSALGCSINGVIALAAVATTFGTIAAVVISLIALLR